MTGPGTIYRTATAGRLHPRHVRDRQFGVTHIGRRGLDPREVRQFLHRVAYELAALHRELARTNEENVRIKRALRNWQSEQTTRSRW
jgi:DivIVA domain-containing protein